MPRVLETWLTKATGVRYPFIQGGMMHVGHYELVAAVANAGALGFITAFSTDSPEALRQEIRKCKELTSGRPFGVNFTLLPTIKSMNYSAYAEVAVEEGITIFETAGNPMPIMHILRKVENLVHIHKVVSIKHAIKAQALGVSAVTIDGFECAGHPGEDGVGSIVLLARASQVLHIPFMASGGFATGKSIAAAFALGAQGVSMGTRWLCTEEAPVHNEIKMRIVLASETDTSILLHSLNNSVRCYKNPVANEVEMIESEPDFVFGKVVNLMAGVRGAKAMKTGNPDDGIWSMGQCAGTINDIPTCYDLVRQLNQETITAIDSAAGNIVNSSLSTKL